MINVFVMGSIKLFFGSRLWKKERCFLVWGIIGLGVGFLFIDKCCVNLLMMLNNYFVVV